MPIEDARMSGLDVELSQKIDDDGFGGVMEFQQENGPAPLFQDTSLNLRPSLGQTAIPELSMTMEQSTIVENGENTIIGDGMTTLVTDDRSAFAVPLQGYDSTMVTATTMMGVSKVPLQSSTNISNLAVPVKGKRREVVARRRTILVDREIVIPADLLKKQLSTTRDTMVPFTLAPASRKEMKTRLHANLFRPKAGGLGCNVPIPKSLYASIFAGLHQIASLNEQRVASAEIELEQPSMELGRDSNIPQSPLPSPFPMEHPDFLENPIPSKRRRESPADEMMPHIDPTIDINLSITQTPSLSSVTPQPAEEPREEVRNTEPVGLIACSVDRLNNYLKPRMPLIAPLDFDSVHTAVTSSLGVSQSCKSAAAFFFATLLAAKNNTISLAQSEAYGPISLFNPIEVSRMSVDPVNIDSFAA